MTYFIRNIQFEEMNTLVDWAAKEGWNPGLQDATAFFAADPNGFFIGMLNGEPISCISAVKYSESFGFIGFYIVKPEYRGQGFGIKIWNHALQYLKNCTIGLDGVVAQQENYRKSGFKLAYNNARYEGISPGKSNRENLNIIEPSAVSWDALCNYDYLHFTQFRLDFLQNWIAPRESRALVYQDGRKISGYGVIRKCQIGYKIGPLFADNPEIAENLFDALSGYPEKGSPIYLDIPVVNSQARNLALKKHMQIVFETARMYSGVFPVLPLEQVYGVTSFELG
ncbi:MAG: hypothetical protein RLZZ241_1797 [Bacteroidota bacterium]|jgi:GNAT superfamily N-acetyltransferase